MMNDRLKHHHPVTSDPLHLKPTRRTLLQSGAVQLHRRPDSGGALSPKPSGKRSYHKEYDHA